MSELKGRRTDDIILNYDGIRACAKTIEEDGKKYQEIANVFQSELRNLKNSEILSSNVVNQKIDEILKDTQDVLDSLQKNCDSYAFYLNQMISDFMDADH